VRRLLKERNPFGWLWVPGSEQPIEQVKCFGDSQGAGPTALSYEDLIRLVLALKRGTQMSPSILFDWDLSYRAGIGANLGAVFAESHGGGNGLSLRPASLDSSEQIQNSERTSTQTQCILFLVVAGS
jgi:hypothetical protein